MSKKSLWLIIVAVVVGGLVFIALFPVFMQAKDGRSDPCLTNLKQLGLAMSLYAGDYDGTLPPASSWQDALMTAITNDDGWDEEAFVCPATKHPYVFNGALGGRDINEIADHEKMPLFWDSLTDGGAPPHVGRFNVVFLDTHCQRLAEDELMHMLFSLGNDAWGMKIYYYSPPGSAQERDR